MFERRLRIFMFVLFLGGLILAARAAQVQVAQRDEWSRLATTSAERVNYLTPERGDILDVKGRVLATDEPAFEACVNYRVISPDGPDAAWLALESKRRARALPEWSDADEASRAALIEREGRATLADLESLWDLLARVSNQSRGQIDEVRREIVREVTAKHNAYWQSLYRRADEEFRNTPAAPWYERWIAGERTAPQEATFRAKTIGEQLAFHAVVSDVSRAVYNELRFAQDTLPQYRNESGRWRSVLEIRAAVRRRYPYNDVAAHVIGRVAPVSREDRENDPERSDPLRRYALIDRIGREGIEKLAERQLRGDRGARRTDRRGQHLRTDESTAGNAVRTTIDIALQAAIQQAFESVDFIGPDNPKDAAGHVIPDRMPMQGAAVVIDVETGEVRALVSVPTYDLNRFDELYPSLVSDDLRLPMRNRALQSEAEPGSTAKPIVGLAAVTQGLIGVTDPIECTGRPIIDGEPRERPRCWTLSMFPGAHHIHHSVPWAAPHPTGFLTLADAIERSCNVYFVQEGDKLGIEGLSYWMRQFGYGRTTGVGLPENTGTVPAMASIRTGDRRSEAWYASIGQGKVTTTPIQVANEMATIARDGVWLRPRLVPPGSPVPLPTTRPDGTPYDDRRDLKLDATAVRAVKVGMRNVVNSPAGTGTKVRDDKLGVLIAAKTGSATASQLRRPMRGANGELLYDARGLPRREAVPYGSRQSPNPELPWYRLSGFDDQGKAKGTHSWVGGFLPADKPQVAFAVFVEYGNSGGIAAGSIVKKLVAACVKEGYVTARSMPANPTPVVPELLARPVEEPMTTEEPVGAPVEEE